MITIKDLRNMSVKELRSELDTAKRDLFKIKLDIVSAQEKKNSRVKESKKYIARINTVVTEKLYKLAYESSEDKKTENNPK